MTVTVAIDRLARSVSRRRLGAGAYDGNGNWVAGTPTITVISAAIQPISHAELKDLPEGIRDEAKVAAWSRSDLQLDDTIVDGGRQYRVIGVRPWDQFGFYRAILGEVET